ncbi:MAG TPA: TolC family outer membrane protein [Kaistiaceae bacterium]|nr:TolC family outer membrane protein [Kaistiaceae bacterium]
MFWFLLSVAVYVGIVSDAQAMTIEEAIRLAVSTNPIVAEAAANRRATDHELQQARGSFLPRLDLKASVGPEMFDRPGSFLPQNNRKWRTGKEVTLSVRQILFDGFSSVNSVYRSQARVDAAALRVLERSEAVALDAVEAYIDVLRHRRILGLAADNSTLHRSILGMVEQRFTQGDVGSADRDQATERVAASDVVRDEVRKSLLEAEAKFRRVVGHDPDRLSAPVGARLPAKTLSGNLDLIENNQIIKAALADSDAARFEYEMSKGAFYPTVALTGSATVGDDLGGVSGRNNTYEAKVVASWNVFNGGIDKARKSELAERWTEKQIHVDVLRRDAREAVERSFAAVTTVASRIADLEREVAANQRVVVAYAKEYEIGQRTLLDRLDAENALFNARIQLESARAIYLFATYQLRATTGGLVAYVGAAVPQEAVASARDDGRLLPGFKLDLEPLRQD